MPDKNSLKKIVNQKAITKLKKIRERIRKEKAAGKPDYALMRLLKALKKSDDFRTSSMARGGHMCTR